MASRNEVNKEKVTKEILQLWNSSSKDEYDLLLKNISINKYKKNENVYRDSERPMNALLLISGKVKIYKDGINGRSQIVRIIKPVEFFGYRAYFANEIYKTAAMAIENCVVASFPIEILTRMMAGNFNIAVFFIRNLSKELGTSDDRTVNLTQKHIRARLAETLIFLKDKYGLEADGYTLSIYLSREDIACMSNMTTSNAIRTLSAMANEQLIAVDGRKIQIIEDEKLREISKLG